jgi:hypothetical protein
METRGMVMAPTTCSLCSDTDITETWPARTRRKAAKGSLEPVANGSAVSHNELICVNSGLPARPYSSPQE